MECAGLGLEQERRLKDPPERAGGAGVCLGARAAGAAG
jgi:hypothetical protein